MRNDVERLALHVLGAHVDVALEAEQRAGRRRRDAVLPGAGLGDDPALAHADREQRLAERVVDLVRAGVGQVFALEEDPRAAGRLRSAAWLRRPASAARRSASAGASSSALKRRVVARREVGALELLDRLDQRLGHEAAAELAEVAARVGIAARQSTVTVAHCPLVAHALEKRRHPLRDP